MPIIFAYVSRALPMSDSSWDRLSFEWTQIVGEATGCVPDFIAVWELDLVRHRNADPIELRVEFEVGKWANAEDEDPDVVIDRVVPLLTRKLREALRQSPLLPDGVYAGVFVVPVRDAMYERTRAGAAFHEENLAG